MTKILKVGLFFLSIFGFSIGIALVLGVYPLLDMCGKGCGLARALTATVGEPIAAIVIGSIWIGLAFLLVRTALSLNSKEPGK
jgi:hypothetical protein